MNSNKSTVYEVYFTLTSVDWGEGSRVSLHLNGGVKHAHRPHPGKEAKRYQIKEIGEWLKAAGVKQ
ncbi:MAG: type II toxin-antitoxin system HicA family toxin [Comamonadaceae bacterium CG_4_9_14_0_8_um_filter_57_21]|nr:MAG: type II toxin-antitoxin system HicA family toxin [Comamonadaceae bacterium CG_4_9_14_0_8_um_filter_57_21]